MAFEFEFDIDRPVKVAFPLDVHITGSTPKSRKDHYFASMMAKFEHVVEENDFVVQAGDFWDKTTCDIGTLVRVAYPVRQQVRSGKWIFTIPGNHDLPHYNLNRMHETTLGLMDGLEIMRVFEKLRIGPVRIGAIPFAKPMVFPSNPDCDILIGHAFYESTADPEFTFRREDIEGCGVPYVILGHDHEPHKEMQIGQTRLFRPGSLCRNTSHKFQLERMPQYLRMIITPDGIESVTVEPIPCARPPREVFHPEAFDKPSENKLAFFSNMDAIVARFSKQTARQHTGLTVGKVLAEKGVPEWHVNYIRYCYERLGMEFR